MIGTGADDPYFDAVLRIPLKKDEWEGQAYRVERAHPRKAIEDVNIVAGVEVIDSTLAVDFERV